MRRLYRWLLSALTVLSLLLCMATAGLWLQSTGTWDRYWRVWLCETPTATQSRQWTFEYGQGGFRALHITASAPAARASRFRGFIAGTVNQGWTHEDPEHSASGARVNSIDLEPSRRSYARALRQDWSVCGLAYLSAYSDGESFQALKVPYLFPVAISAILPALVVTRRVTVARRRRRSACLRCSYDLTGNVSSVCPECGTQTNEIASARTA